MTEALRAQVIMADAHRVIPAELGLPVAVNS